MKIIEVSESKIGKMSDCVEEMLKIGGRLMSCLEELEGGGYGERDTYGMTGEYGMNDDYGMRGGSGRYANRMGYRDEDGWPVMSRYGERGRRRNRLGQFV